MQQLVLNTAFLGCISHDPVALSTANRTKKGQEKHSSEFGGLIRLALNSRLISAGATARKGIETTPANGAADHFPPFRQRESQGKDSHNGRRGVNRHGGFFGLRLCSSC